MASGESVKREHYWLDVLRRQRTSGQSIRAFCLGNGINQASFFSWRRRLTKRLGKSMEPVRFKSPSETAKSAFVPVTIQPANISGGTIELLHPRGHVLRIPSRFDAESLARILDVLDREQA